MRYKYLGKIDRVEVEIVHILVIITAMTQNHGSCRKSWHKAKTTVITAIVNSRFTYTPTKLYTLAACAVTAVTQRPAVLEVDIN